MADADANPLLNAAASAGGAVLRTTFGTLAVLRRSAKPLHPSGEVHVASVHRYGASPRTGVPWLDEPGSDQAIVRFSRATGLPAPVPDVLGIAIRLTGLPAPVDLLFASTGRRSLGRFVLTAHRDRMVAETTYTTLLPYRGPHGPLLLAATPSFEGDHLSLRLAVSGVTGAWQEFGTVLVDAAGKDERISFDPIRNPLPDLPPYGWVSRLREGAYAAAREHRGPDRPFAAPGDAAAANAVSAPVSSPGRRGRPSSRGPRSAAPRG